MTPRAAIQGLLDACQFRFDIFPELHYQPLPLLGLRSAKRSTGTIERWKAIEASLVEDEAIHTALDIGCNVGYFCFSLAQRGIVTLGIDVDDRVLRIARHASKRLSTSGVGWCHLELSKTTLPLLPEVDLVLLLSVWHHWVREFGFENASAMLSMTWARCNRVLFFETGETEMPEGFGLPDMRPSPEKWIASYLADLCSGAGVKCIGRFKAFGAGGDERCNVAYRHLFKVHRTDAHL